MSLKVYCYCDFNPRFMSNFLMLDGNEFGTHLYKESRVLATWHRAMKQGGDGGGGEFARRRFQMKASGVNRQSQSLIWLYKFQIINQFSKNTLQHCRIITLSKDCTSSGRGVPVMKVPVPSFGGNPTTAMRWSVPQNRKVAQRRPTTVSVRYFTIC